MKIISCTELRTRLGKYLRAIQRGHSFLITNRGIVIAKITPVHDQRRA
jgi:prevent-host-death family protein